MGAYSNPQEVVDTQTGQHFQNLQNTISQTVAGVASSYKAEAERGKKEDEENKKKLDAIVFKAEKESLAMYNDVGKLSQAKPGVNFKEALNPFVEETSKLNIALDTGASIDRQGDLQKIAEYRGTVDYLQGDIANISADAEGFYDKVKKRGRMGGLATDLDLNKADDVEGYLGLINKIDAKTSIKTNLQKPSERTWLVKIGDKEIPFDGATIQKIHDNNSELFTIIPDTTDNMLKLVQDSGVYDIKMEQNSKGESIPTIGYIKPEYLGPIEREPSKSTVPGKQVNQLKQKVKIDEIKAKIFPAAKVQADGILSNPREAQAWYNDIAVNALKLKNKVTAAHFLDDAGKYDFYKAYLDYALLPLEEYQYVMNTPGDIATETIDTKPARTKTTSPTTNSGKNKQEDTQEELQKKAEDLKAKLQNNNK